MVRSTLLPIQLQTGPKGEIGRVTTICSVDTFFDIFEDLNLLNIIKVSYEQALYAKLMVRSTLLLIQLHTGPKGEIMGGVTTISSVGKFFDIFEDLNLLNIIKVSYVYVLYANTILL